MPPWERVRACVIFNPAARGEKARRAVARLGRLGSEATLRPTQAAGDGARLACEASDEGFDTIVAVGGDGTINEVLNGLAASTRGLDAARLAVLPLGTANVFARELGIPMRVERAWEVVMAGRTRQIDALEMEFTHQRTRVTRLCLQLAGAGLDARATELVDWKLKKRWGFLAYVIACFNALRESQTDIEITPLQADPVHAQLVLIGNGRLYGGPFGIFPGADLSDGVMDLAVFPRVNAALVAACCWAAATNRWSSLRPVVRLQAEEVHLSSANRTPLELDGEPVGELPASCRVLPQALQVIVP